MKVSCQACGAKYTIADDKVRGRKVKIRCKSCGTPIVVDGQSETPAVPAGSAPAAAPAPASAGPAISWSVNLSDTDQRTMTTAEIVAGWKSGEVTSDAFVWKDGMGDWVAILESPDLAPLLSGAQAAPGAAGGTPFGPTVVTATTEPAKLSGGGRGAGVDLFNAAASAPEEDDVATSAPALPTAGSTAYDDGKMTGARNENSVLFSLDSLKGGLAPENKKSPTARKPTSSASQSGDPFAMSPAEVGGGNALFSLNTNQALLTAPAAPEPPPPRLDSTGAPTKPMNKAVVYGGGGAAAVLLLGIGLLLGRTGNKEEGPAADSSAKVATADSAEADKKGEAKDKEATEEKKEEKKEEKPAESAAASASAAPSAAAAPTTKAPSTKSTGTPTTTAPKEPKASTPQAKPEEMPSQGTAPFSVSAAQVALTQAASNAGSCAKPGGPTGSGKVQVTFATSGRVTTANVAGPPFGGTPVGGCVAGVFRKARIPSFAGNPVTVSKSFAIH
jgi:predicted Zn finger-like uncharacterized protein